MFEGLIGTIIGALLKAAVEGVLSWLARQKADAAQQEIGAQAVAIKDQEVSVKLGKVYADIGVNPPDALASLDAGTF